MLRYKIEQTSHRLRKSFSISRGTRDHAVGVKLHLTLPSGLTGVSECTPYARYGETTDSVIGQIDGVLSQGVETLDALYDVLTAMPAGAARNAIDCAVFDLMATQREDDIYQRPHSETKTYLTIDLVSLEDVCYQAKAFAQQKIDWIKLKVDRSDVVAKVDAVVCHNPQATIIIDPNESWDIACLNTYARDLKDYPIAFIEQPLACEDLTIGQYDGTIDLCADESFHTTEDLECIRPFYQVVNIKLDKSGGLREALNIVKAARRLGLKIMLGCMMSGELAIRPALSIAPFVDYVDLDAPFWLAENKLFELQGNIIVLQSNCA